MSQLDEPGLTARVDEMLNRWPAVGLAVGVVRNGSLEFFSGHGVADVAAKTPITEDTIFRIASITKTFTAIAAMQLWEQGLIDLDAPANDYLRAYRLVPAKSGFGPVTVRHLLTHTAGIGEVAAPSDAFRPFFGESVRAGHPVPSLAEYYRGALRVGAEPGTRFRYTDHGIATVGQIVEDVSGQPFARYLREHVFEPLGMMDTTLTRSDVDSSRLATGYKLSSRGATEIPLRDMAPAGAVSAYSTPRDMARYLSALMGGGSNEHGSVLEPATLATMFEAHYQPDPRLPGIGLAFFRVKVGGHPMVEHQGVLPGFNSQIFVAPDDGVGIMAFTNGAHGAGLWMATETGQMLTQLLGAPIDVIRTDLPQHPEVWADICGWYLLPGPLTDTRVRATIGLGVEVFVRAGKLFLRFLTPIPGLYKGFIMHADDPDDPFAFRMDVAGTGLSTFRVIFAREPATNTMEVHLDLMPLSAQKRPESLNPRRLALVGAVITGAAVLAGRRLTRRHR